MNVHRVVIAGCVLLASSSICSVAFAQGTAPPQPDPPQQQPAGYPPEPQQGDPQQQQGYPPPQQGDPQQQGYPPPQQGYPQQGYPQQGFGQAGGYPAQTPPPPRSSFLKMAYVGVTLPVGKSSDYEDPGLRLGTILGVRLSPQLSLNGELTFDIDNPKGTPDVSDVSEVEVDVAFSPLFHLPSGSIELVVGPKLGINTDVSSGTFAGQTNDWTTTGWVAGLNAGFFSTLSGSTSIGGLVSFVARKGTESCQSVNGGPDHCMTVSGGSSYKVLGITGAINF